MTPLELKDLAGLSEPLTKLIGVCAEGIGAVARPWLMRRDAKAALDASLSLQQAGLEVISVNIPSISAEITARVEYREAKIHNNLQKIVSAAKEALPESVSSDEVDSDWIGRFFSYAQDVSNEEMQLLWGRLLSGEVARPGAFSLRTLELVRSLSVSEANTFSKLMKFVLHDSYFLAPDNLLGTFGRKSGEFELFDDGDDWKIFYAAQRITSADFQLLEEINLITSPLSVASRTWNSKNSSWIATATRGNQAIMFRNPSANGQAWSVTIPTQELTHIGRQLAQLVEHKEFSEDFLVPFRAAAQKCGLRCGIALLKVNPATGKQEWWIDEEDTR